MADDVISVGEFYKKLRDLAEDDFVLLDKKTLESGLNRRECAHICYEYLRKVLKEEPEANWKSAGELSDLYDCHVCVASIAECYCKGIMDKRTSYVNGKKVEVFDANTPVLKKEAKNIISRLLDSSLRSQRLKSGDEKSEPVKIDRTILEKWIADNKSVNIIDVRSRSDFEAGHYPKARNVELKAFMNNPYILLDNTGEKGEEYCFVCNEGYLSEMAARMAITAGYNNVFYLGLLL